MAITSVRLVNGADVLVLLPRDDLKLQKLSVPFPETRAVSQDRTGADGQDDQTGYHGGRACSIELHVLSGPGALVDALARFCYPGDRPYLYVIDDEWPGERRLRLRADTADPTIGVDLPPTMRRIQAQWRVPDGVWEDVTSVTTVVPVDTPSTAGLAVPVVIPATFAAGTGAGARIITTAGTVPLQWTARLYGPCTAPRLANETTGETLVFKTSMVLAAGEYLDIDSRERAVYLLGDTSNSRLADVDYTATSWWRLAKGANQIRYNPSSSSAGAQAEIYTRTQWL